VPYQGVPCTLRNAKSGQYGGSRNFYMVTRGAPTGAAKSWISWITHSAAAASIVGTDWVPLH
jgi:phosphate transport system substrate-binding protein